MTSTFLTSLDVRLIKDESNELWELLAPLTYRSVVASCQITVPKGFQTDFCSVPRVPFIYDILGNRARRAGTVHDYLYSVKMFSREQCDLILKEMVVVCGVAEVEAEEFYLAVRLGGASHYE